MPTSPENKDELLEVIYRLGGREITKNVHLPEAKMHLDHWEKETFWDTAQALIDDQLLLLRNNKGYAAMSLQGRKKVEDRLNPPTSHTHNVVSGTFTNSPIQQGGAHSVQHQAVTYTQKEQDDLNQLVTIFDAHLDELEMDVRQKRRAEAQVATLKAQLADEPDPIIVKQAGRTLRNITEGAVGSLVAAAAQPGIWAVAADIMTRLFS